MKAASALEGLSDQMGEIEVSESFVSSYIGYILLDSDSQKLCIHVKHQVPLQLCINTNMTPIYRFD